MEDLKGSLDVKFKFFVQSRVLQFYDQDQTVITTDKNNTPAAKIKLRHVTCMYNYVVRLPLSNIVWNVLNHYKYLYIALVWCNPRRDI